MYYKHLGMQRVEKQSEEEMEMVEFLVFNKEDILQGKIDFSWIRSQEFKYNENMYDIVKKAENDKQIFLYCINDTKEKKLENEYDKRVDENTTDKKQKPNDSNPFTSIFSEPVYYITFNQINSTYSTYKGYNNGIFNQVIGDVLTPPPQSFSVI